MATKKRRSTKSDDTMTVQQAGELGGRATAQTHGREFYESIGHRGGQRVRELIQQGKQAEQNARTTRISKDLDKAA